LSEKPDILLTVANTEEPDELEIPTTIAQFVLGTDPIAELGVQLFEVKSVPGKGRGLVAPFNIAKGKRIISEKPLFTTHNISQPGVMEINVAAKLRALSKPEQRQFLSLHNNFPGKNPFGGIVKTNALPCGPDSIVGGIYPTICLINHSCLPNAHNSWNSNTNCETIHATRFIPAGEEITIPYDKGGPSSVRQAQLKEGFGFICTCNLCSLPPTMLQASDARRLEIQRLDDAIGDPTRVLNKPADSLVDCQSLLKVLQEEYNGNPGILLARLYYDAFQISITHSDQARASIFAGRGYNARVAYEGEDSPETARIKGLMEHPAGHASYGASKRWRTSKGMVPKGLDAEEFERWLWRV
jgi:hypothetical protein